MAKITKEEALRYHAEGKPGKIEVIPTKPHSTQTDLSLAYSPGVAEPCLEIEKNPLDAAPAKVMKMPNCAAAPKRRDFGFARSGEKSVIAPIPINTRGGRIPISSSL